MSFSDRVRVRVRGYLHICYLLFNLFIFLYIHLFNVIFSHTEKKQNRQEDRNKNFTCPADRRRLDRDRVSNLHLLSYLLSLSHVF